MSISSKYPKTNNVLHMCKIRLFYSGIKFTHILCKLSAIVIFLYFFAQPYHFAPILIPFTQLFGYAIIFLVINYHFIVLIEKHFVILVNFTFFVKACSFFGGVKK